MPLTPAPRPANAGVVHASWGLRGGIMQALAAPDAREQIAAAVAPLHEGDSAEAIHELDHKVATPNDPASLNPLTGKPITLAEGLAAKNAFHAHVKAVRPDLLTVNTLTAGLFEWHADKASAYACDADLLGVDFDGMKPDDLDYFDWTVAIGKAQTFVRTYGLRGWCAPEVGSVLAAGDDGTARGRWLARFRTQLENAGCRYAAEYGWGPGSTDAFEDAASAEAWKMTA